MLDAWPVLGDFAYVKMLVTLIIHRLNEEFVSQSKPQVGWGPISYELKNIDYARKFFARTRSFKACVKAFMNVNSMSLVAYPVGLHHDHFNAGGESLENKITFVLKGCNGLTGRGGSLFNNEFVFAFLDWRYEICSSVLCYSCRRDGIRFHLFSWSWKDFTGLLYQ